MCSDTILVQMLWNNERKLYFHRNYPEQKEGLQHEIGHLHLWMLWIRYKIFPTVLLIPAHINMYRNKQIFSENQRMERNVVVVTYRKEVSSTLLGCVCFNHVTISFSVILTYKFYKHTVCHWHQLEYNQEYKIHLYNTYHDDGAYGQLINFHISDSNFLSLRIIGKLWSRLQKAKWFVQD